MKNILCLTYHDFYRQGLNNSTSGNVTHSSHLYKMDINMFDRQLNLLNKNNLLIKNSIELDSNLRNKVILTFDDGGSSSYHLCLKILEKYNTKGIFFITASFLNKEGFLTSEELLEISNKGHLIGNHSFSHPQNISSLSFNQIKDEWARCNKVLNSIIKKDVKLASIPGGYYSEKVKKSAIESGINFLFTSEPEKKIRKQNDILLIGRFPIMYNSSENYPFQLFVSRWARISVQTLWKLKKLLKMLPFNFYLHMRAIINSLRFG